MVSQLRFITTLSSPCVSYPENFIAIYETIKKELASQENDWTRV